MKRIIFIALLLITVTMIFTSAYALAETTTEQQICELALQNERVTKAKCLVYERNCLVAIKTEKFSTKTDYDKFINELSEKIKEQFEIDNVFVTRNPKVMHKLAMLENLDGDKRDKLIKELIERELNREEPHIMPRAIVW